MARPRLDEKVMPWTLHDIPDQSGRTAVVTGGNGGLGLATVRELAKRGASVVIAARNLAKAGTAREQVELDFPGCRMSVMELDLASLDSVRRFAGALSERASALDLLINNAGIMAPPRIETEDGFEAQFGVNHLGHFALTGLLMPSLLGAPAGRVVTVTSFARFFRSPLDPADPHSARSYDPWQAYGLSKMANFQFAVALDRRLRASGASARSLAAHPGLTYTELQAQSVEATAGGRGQRFWHFLARTVGTPPARGARPILRAATDPEAGGGELYGPLLGGWGPPVRRPVLESSVRDDELETLWEVSEREAGIEFPL